MMHPSQSWVVHSSRDWIVQYVVEFDPNLDTSWACSCPGFQFGRLCKHIRRIQEVKCPEIQPPVKAL